MMRLARTPFAILIVSISLFVVLHTRTLAQQQPPAPRQLSQADWEQVHTMTVAAMNELYNFKFPEAEQRCNDVLRLVPQDPRGHFFKAMIFYYRSLVYREQADFDKFMGYSARGIQVCEAILKDNPKDSKALFYMGGLQGYRGLVLGSKKEYMKALWDGKRGHDNLKAALEADPSNVDAQMGLGLFSYFISQAPAVAQPAIKLSGMTGDRIMGLKYLETVAAKGVYAKNEAAFWLSQFYQGNTEQQYERANYHLNNLTSQYPNNGLFQAMHGGLLLNTRKVDKAIAVFRGIADRGVIQFNKEEVGRAVYLLGISYRLKNQWAEAIQWYQKCIALSADARQKNDSHADIGWCYEVQGNRSAAISHYQQAGDDPDAAERLKQPWTPHEILLTKQRWFFSAGDDDASSALGEQLLASQGVANDVRGKCLYYLGRLAFEKGDFAKAEERYAQAMATPVGDQEKESETNKAQQAELRYRLGLAQAKLNKKSDAKTSFDAALSYTKYRNEDTMKRLIQKELARLKKG